MNSRRMQPLVNRAREREDSAAKQYAAQQQAQAQQEQRLDELRRYAEEYMHAGQGTVAPALLANRYAFVARIDHAIQQQAKNVDRSRERTDIERARLLIASRDTKVMEKLAASYRAEEAKKVESRLQREMDDLAARGVRARRAEDAQ
ncbi:flagellar export protein FliJ [Coralloluteibacterium stylophorae]|uniref:Flagellar FliJ protein n=1 Tax=Coralloluteibacterium stylophorae TaxID=1776034 RepID=A0A8J7VWD4_9GAMM|nr:flagellar export protein FliJ [Coralloluteibacterium stylophorae]MBS7457220.1 flagellar export protein FliJ [Coralloluteibacterium stylophorae]